MVPMAAAISSATNENAVLPIDRHSLLTNDPVQLGSAVASRISAERLNDETPMPAPALAVLKIAVPIAALPVSGPPNGALWRCVDQLGEQVGLIGHSVTPGRRLPDLSSQPRATAHSMQMQVPLPSITTGAR